jgi:hypothetical protein
MKTINVEMLMGHNVGLAENYYRPTESELLKEYLKAGRRSRDCFMNLWPVSWRDNERGAAIGYNGMGNNL